MPALVVYADLVFLANLAIDYALLGATSWVRGLRPRRARLLLASLIGASYVVLSFFPPFSFLFISAVKLLLSLLMVGTAFGFGGLPSFARSLGAFYAVNFAAAGGVLGMHYLLQSSAFWSGIAYTRTGGTEASLQLGVIGVTAAAAASLYLFRRVLESRRRAAHTGAHLAEVTVQIAGSSRSCTGLVDTGNQLYDPLTRTPVMVMEAALWQDELPPAWLETIRSADVDKLVAGLSSGNPGPWGDRLRLVPYRGVNRDTSFMLAVKPDAVRIDRGGEIHEPAKALIGLDGGRLAGDGAYRAIIHPSLLAGEPSP